MIVNTDSAMKPNSVQRCQLTGRGTLTGIALRCDYFLLVITCRIHARIGQGTRDGCCWR